MTTCYFERQTDEQIAVAVAGLEKCSFVDERDGCRTVALGCSCCDDTFLELLEVAKKKVVGRRPLLCIECDPRAVEPAFSSLTDKFGMWAE